MENYFFCFSMRYEDDRTDLLKEVSIYTQIVRNGLAKCSKYTILQYLLTLKVRQKCNFLLLPSNQGRSKRLGYCHCGICFYWTIVYSDNIINH